ncbi:MAG TPA: LLM class flavin-dependent oxidoreductase [Thermomicrobiales bacterium]|jgi:hypothetical protein|nr:LLM class flavin-dependent oxidoreductase [Thermomicrobiales bacterium]
MQTYGHPLQFGTFITPRAADPDAVVDLAVLSEELGYDLVTFQDHPYQAEYLDTWTLLSWVAARTERIIVSGNVLNLPLRPAPVLARAAASLDRLSGGRFAMGLGAGGFYDPIAAMGGPKLTAGEAVSALEEGITLLRQFWDTGQRGGVRLAGEHYQVRGAKRGPAPAHDIPIWLGAYKPRMLRLTGEKADGWLPSLPYLQPGDIAKGNAIIDAAAVEAGRDPGEIRRMLNIGGRFTATSEGPLQGPPDSWVADLLPYALEDGVSTFILMADDPETMRRFAAEVMPALRDAVDRAGIVRSGPPPRGAAALAKRRAGIDYDGLPASLADVAIEPGDKAFATVHSTYMRGGDPGLVLQVRDVGQVQEALVFARRHPDIPLATRSGGHGLSGRSTNDGGIVIDVSRLNEIRILDEAQRLVRIGPGAKWVDVAAALEPHGWALTSGDYGGVGVGGLATAGGVGWLARKHGLTIDHLRAAEIVLADGTLVRTSEDEHPDLFWAIRGAGANFGIVTAFEFEVDVVGPVGWAQLAFDASDTASFLERWGAQVERSPRDLTANLIVQRGRRGQPNVAIMMAVVDSPDPDTIISRLQPFADIAPLLDQQVTITSYRSVMANLHETTHYGRGEPAARSALVEHFTPAFSAWANGVLASGETYWFQVRSVGGAVGDIDPDATAYANRSDNFSVVAFGFDRDRLDRIWDTGRHHFGGLYLSFDASLHPDRISEAFPPRTLDRLRMLKDRYDPDNVFRDNFNVAIVEPEVVLG